MENQAAKVQAKPLQTEKSVDVLDSLVGLVPSSIFKCLEERVELGVRKYGSRLKTHSVRDAALDCFQEALDGIMYAQQLCLEGRDDGSLRKSFIVLASSIYVRHINGIRLFSL